MTIKIEILKPNVNESQDLNEMQVRKYAIYQTPRQLILADETCDYPTALITLQFKTAEKTWIRNYNTLTTSKFSSKGQIQ